MKALILIIILFSISCKKQDSSMNESNYQNPILANNYYDSDESFSSNKNELKILVVGHLYDMFVDYPEKQSDVRDMINNQDADLVILGGDSIFGNQGKFNYEGVNAADDQWKDISDFRASLNKKSIMVSGNHDGWSYDELFQNEAYAKFRSHNKINYSISGNVGDRKVGLHFVYTGDFNLPAERFQPIKNKLKKFDENLIFGGHRVNSSTVLNTLNTSSSHVKYFSGDYEDDNHPIFLKNVDAYNVTTICKNSLDAILITITETSTKVENIGNCNR